MPLGTIPAGLGPAGSDPVQAGSRPRGLRYPRAIFFDAGLRDFPMASNGKYFETHPVDQKVNLKLTIRRGTLAGNPEVGQGLQDIKFASKKFATTAAKDDVKITLADELKAKEIELQSIEVDVPQDGAIAVAVPYVNLQLLADKNRIFPASES